MITIKPLTGRNIRTRAPEEVAHIDGVFDNERQIGIVPKKAGCDVALFHEVSEAMRYEILAALDERDGEHFERLIKLPT